MASAKHLALLFVGLLLAAPAAGQCRLCDKPATAAPTEALAGDVDLRIDTNLNFDRLVLSGIGRGAATIRPDRANGAEGAVLEIGPRATVGTVVVHGEANRPLIVDMPHRIELYSISGGRISLVDVVTDLPASPRLDAAGALSFRFGGRLIVSGDDEGQYRGDLTINVEYAVDPSASEETLSAR